MTIEGLVMIVVFSSIVVMILIGIVGLVIVREISRLLGKL